MPHDKRLAQLLSLAGGSPSNSERWDSIETELGIPLPPQYKLIVDTFDDLSFGDFIHVLSPFSDGVMRVPSVIPRYQRGLVE